MDNVIGVEEIQANIQRVIDQLAPEEVESSLLLGAQVIAESARANAPMGETGNLKRSIEAKVIHREQGSVAAIAAVNYRKGPHAHLVEFGHIAWRGGRRKKKQGRALKVKSTGTKFVPAHPFFRPAWDENAETVKEGVLEDLKSKVEGAVE